MPRPKTLPVDSTVRSVTLPDPHWRALQLIAAVHGTSAAEIMRQAIQELISAEAEANGLIDAALTIMCREHERAKRSGERHPVTPETVAA